jgi:hypothetical protein
MPAPRELPPPSPAMTERVVEAALAALTPPRGRRRVLSLIAITIAVAIAIGLAAGPSESGVPRYPLSFVSIDHGGAPVSPFANRPEVKVFALTHTTFAGAEGFAKILGLGRAGDRRARPRRLQGPLRRLRRPPQPRARRPQAQASPGQRRAAALHLLPRPEHGNGRPALRVRHRVGPQDGAAPAAGHATRSHWSRPLRRQGQARPGRAPRSAAPGALPLAPRYARPEIDFRRRDGM